jgi:hypothetical protein
VGGIVRPRSMQCGQLVYSAGRVSVHACTGMQASFEHISSGESPLDQFDRAVRV